MLSLFRPGPAGGGVSQESQPDRRAIAVMQRIFLTAAYVSAHLATASLCFGLVVVVPFLCMLAAAIWANDPGGPLFWPLFILLLAATGLTLACVCSALVLVADLVRFRWRVPVWIPSAVVFLVASLLFVGNATWSTCLMLGIVSCAAFSLYWLGVSCAWFLPRFLVRVFRS